MCPWRVWGRVGVSCGRLRPRLQQPSCARGPGRGTPASPPGGLFTSHSGLGAAAGHSPSLGEGNPLRPSTEGAGPSPQPGRPRAPVPPAAAHRGAGGTRRHQERPRRILGLGRSLGSGARTNYGSRMKTCARQLCSTEGILPSETHFPIPGPPGMHSWALTRLGLSVSPGLRRARQLG